MYKYTVIRIKCTSFNSFRTYFVTVGTSAVNIALPALLCQNFRLKKKVNLDTILETIFVFVYL